MTPLPPELAPYLSDLLDGSLDGASRQALGDLLRDNPTLQDHYRNMMALHALLHLDFGQGRQVLLPPLLGGKLLNVSEGENSSFGQCADVVAQIDEQLEISTGDPRKPAPIELIRKVRSFSATRMMIVTAGLAASLMLAAWLLSPLPTRQERAREAARQEFVQRDVTNVAMLAQAADAIWGTSRQVLDVGGPLSSGRFKLNRGIVQIEFFSGATVVVEAPADFELASPMKLVCNLGRMRANVPSQAHGFAIETPKYTAVDLGTEFTVQVDNRGESEIHVLNGEVELWDRQDKQSELAQLLTTGRGVRSTAGGDLSPIVDSVSNFIGSERVLELSQAELKQRFTEWRAFSGDLRKDPRVLVYYGFDGHAPWERVLKNDSTNINELLDGAIVGCHWTTGRWNGKQALEFKRTSDRVRLNVPGEFESLTLAAWVRIEGLERWLSSLMLTDGHQPGEVHWQMTELGQLMLGVKAEVDQSHDFYSPSVLSPRDLGRWAHLACVYDGSAGLVTHYLDGEEVSHESIQIPTTLRIGAAEIGNWVPEDLKDNRVRSLNGRMDEFVILNTPLTGREIRDIFKAGKPQ